VCTRALLENSIKFLVVEHKVLTVDQRFKLPVEQTIDQLGIVAGGARHWACSTLPKVVLGA